MPAVTAETADKIQEVTGDKSNTIYPLFTDKEPFGAIAYVKKVVSDFKNERETLGIISGLVTNCVDRLRLKHGNIYRGT